MYFDLLQAKLILCFIYVGKSFGACGKNLTSIAAIFVKTEGLAKFQQAEVM